MSEYLTEEQIRHSMSLLNRLDWNIEHHFLEEAFRVDKIAMKWLTSLLTEAELDPELEELVQKVLKQTKGLRNNDLSFGPLFPEERTYFPVNVNVDEELIEKMGVPREISEYLASKDLDVEDYRQGLAFSKKNPSRKIRIGKVLKGQAQLKKVFDKRLAGEIKKPKKLLAVFTYNPRDIATMSTGRGWTSCADLDPNGEYGAGVASKQIPDKIIQGGMVAYLINEDDKDIERPIARISIRRLVSLNDGSFILLPENICYGAQVDEFTEVVSEVLEKSNEQTSDDEFGIFKDAEGGYSDTFHDVIERGTESFGHDIVEKYFDDLTGAMSDNNQELVNKLNKQMNNLKPFIHIAMERHDVSQTYIQALYNAMNVAIDKRDFTSIKMIADIAKILTETIDSQWSNDATDEIDLMDIIFKEGNVDIYDIFFKQRAFNIDLYYDTVDTVLKEILSGEHKSKKMREYFNILNDTISQVLYSQQAIKEINNLDEEEIKRLYEFLQFPSIALPSFSLDKMLIMQRRLYEAVRKASWIEDHPEFAEMKLGSNA